MSIEDTIRKEIARIEHEKDVRVLYACESGSRAWGFASADSDYDVRFIYLHPRNWYLSIAPQRDVIERMLPDDLDLAGWDLRKALWLMRKSNPPLYEWLDSPIVYQVDKDFLESFRELAKQCFSPARCFYHYRSMAEGNIRNYFDREEVPLKKYLYVLRPVLACQWIERDLGTVPMEFDRMVETLIEDQDLRKAIDDLLALKKSSGEMGTGKKIPALQSFLDRERTRLAEVKWPAAQDTPVEPLNEFFVTMVDG